MIYFIAKPLRGKSARLIPKIKERLARERIDYELAVTSSASDGAILGEKYSREKGSVVVVIGGDGTVCNVLTGLNPANAALGVIPAGTGNDFAAACKIPKGISALDLILKGEPKQTDYLQFSDGRRALNIAGLGMDVDILERYEAMRSHAKVNYFRSLLKSLRSYRGSQMKISSGNFSVEGNFLIAALCNGSRLGGGIPLCPDAETDDGLLDLVYVECPPRKKMLGALIKLMRGKIFTLPFAHRLRVGSAEFSLPAPFTAQYDGELSAVSSFSAHVESDLKFFRG